MLTITLRDTLQNKMQQTNLLFTLFYKHGYQLRFVGGCVRDLLLGKTPNDIDFATTATPCEMLHMFHDEKIKTVATNGIKHGTVVCVVDGIQYEITTLRTDFYEKQKCKATFVDNWKLDASRRDFTINAMSMDQNGKLYDYFDGVYDLTRGLVKCVGNPSDRFRQDFSRILRYFRFCKHVHDKTVLNAIQANVQGLDTVSGERVWKELKRILVKNCKATFELMIHLGVAQQISLHINQYTQMNTENPLLVLSGLLNSKQDVLNLHSRVKMSRNELSIVSYVVTNKHKPINPVEKHVKYMYEFLGVPELPKFPVSGKDLQKLGIPQGKLYSTILNHLLQIWIDGNYKATKSELLNLV